MQRYRPNNDFQIEGEYTRNVSIQNLNRQSVNFTNETKLYWVFEFANGDVVRLDGSFGIRADDIDVTDVVTLGENQISKTIRSKYVIDNLTYMVVVFKTNNSENMFKAERSGNLTHYLIFQDADHYVKQVPVVQSRLVRIGATKSQLDIE